MDDGSFYPPVDLPKYQNDMLPSTLYAGLKLSYIPGNVFNKGSWCHVEFAKHINSVSNQNAIGSSNMQFNTKYRDVFVDCEALTPYFVNAGRYGGTTVPYLDHEPAECDADDDQARV